jgi:hypothetical protein
MFVNHTMHHKRIDASCMLSCNDPKQSYKSYFQNNHTNLTPHHPPNMLCNILLILDIVSIHPQIHILFILAIVSIHQQLLLYITPSYMTLHLGIYHVEIILLQSTRYPHTYDLKVIQISDLIIIIIIIIISSRKKMKTQS